MVRFLDSHDEVGAVSGKFLNPGGALQYAHKRFPTIWAMATHRTFLRYLLGENRAIRYYTMKDNLFDEIMSIEQPPTACLMLKKSLIDKIGLFDEQFSLYFNDVDLCKRIYLEGKNIYFIPDAKITHYIGAATKQLDYDEEKLPYFVGCQRYYKKHHSFIETLFLKTIFSLNYILGIGHITTGLLLGKRKKEELQSRFHCFLKFFMNKFFS
jgi:GT2 family glycosyltransferase